MLMTCEHEWIGSAIRIGQARESIELMSANDQSDMPCRLASGLEPRWAKAYS